MGMVMKKFMLENPSTYNIMMFIFAECADKCLGRLWRFAVTGGNKLVTLLAIYIHYMLLGWLTAVYLDMDSVTSNCMPHLRLAASSLMDNFEMLTLGQIYVGSIDRVAVDYLMSVFVLFGNEWRIWCSTCQLAQFGFDLPLLRGMCIHDLLVCNRRGPW